MASLADLIFNSQEGTPSQPKKEENRRLSSYLKEAYKYDPIEDFYDGQTQSSVRPSDSDNTGTDTGNGTGTDTGADNSKNENSFTATTPTPTTPKYDFELNIQDREFFEPAKSVKKSKSTRKRRDTSEYVSAEDREERLLRQHVRKSRRERFKKRKFNFNNEIDYGNSVSTMVKLKMDFNGKFELPKAEKAECNDSDVGLDEQQTSVLKPEGVNDDDEWNDINGTHDSDLVDGRKRKRESDIGESKIESIHSDQSDEKQLHKEGQQHVLGSLIDRIVEEEEDVLRQQELSNKEEEAYYNNNDKAYWKDKNRMQEDPMSFLKEGYVAPVQIDPNMREYSYRLPSSGSKLKAIRTNKKFRKEMYIAQQKLQKIPQSILKAPITSSTEKKKRYPIDKRKLMKGSGTIPSQYLPINCFNPNVTRLQLNQLQNTYHYLPISRQEPTMLRMNTTKDEIAKELFSPFHDKNQFYNKRASKSFHPKHFHSRNIHIFAARLIVSCAGILSESDDDDGNSNDNNNKNNLSRLLQMLHRKQNSVHRITRIVRLSQEMASNYAMWQQLEERIKSLHNKKCLDDEEYYFIKKELLSHQSEMFTDPNATHEPSDLRSSAKNNRKNILRFLLQLEEDEMGEEKRDEHSQRSDASTTVKDDDHTEDSKIIDPLSKVNKVAYAECTSSLAIAKKCKILSDLPSSNRGEKYSQITHLTELDLDIIQLTLAALYSELSCQRLNEYGNSSQNKVDTVHKTIMSYLELVQNRICLRGNGVILKNHLNGNLAAVTLMRQSYIANSGSFKVPSKLSDETLSSDHNDGESERQKGDVDVVTDFRSIAEELYSFGHDLRGDSKLLIFPSIHMTTGLAAIVKCLPSYAAEVISRPLIMDIQYQQTPFDLVRLALEKMEQKGHIIRKQTTSIYQGDNEGSVHVDTLIANFNLSADIFHGCLENNPENLDCMSWFVATRIGSMIVGSGVIIGSGPCLAAQPEYMIENSTSADTIVRHTEYSKQRTLASRALRELISWQQKKTRQGSRYHFVIKSCLEWSEAVFLLSYRPMIQPVCFRKIQSLHASHSITWAIQEPSITELNPILNQYKDGLIGKNKVLSFISALVESDNNNAKYWTILACALGPLGSIDLSNHQGTENDCRQCMRLRKCKLNHKKLKRQRRKHDWWGNVPSKWWDTHFFVFHSSEKPKIWSFKNSTLSKRIDLSCKGRSYISTLKDYGGSNIKRNLLDVSWMWSAEPSDDNDDDGEDQFISDSESDLESDSQLIADNKVQKQKEKIRTLLPGGENSTERMSIVDPLFDSIIEEDTMIVSKILVACHLYGPDHSFVKGQVGDLWMRFLVRKKKNSVKIFNSLCLLAQQNLNVVSYLEDMKKEQAHQIQIQTETIKCPFKLTPLVP